MSRGRIIPTLVGNGSSATGAPPGSADHPHARGERSRVGLVGTAMGGSSPRSWGTGPRQPRQPLDDRIIPTLVGNGSCAAGSSSGIADHPHARGERAPSWSPSLGSSGSSPRSWGTGRRRVRPEGPARIIPTLVGNGSSTRPSASPRTDHPHARGERTRPAARPGAFSGSSPRSWGTGRDGVRLRPVRRIIPTLVGNGPGGAP